MITVDDRAGSAELYPMLRARGLPVTLGRMSYGDIYFIGAGPDGSPVTVGVEYKTIRDVLSCITDGRFAGHQLPGLVQSYNQVWLAIEGRWRARHPDGILEIQSNHGSWYEASVGTRRFMCRDLYTWLFTMQIKAGIRVTTHSTSVQAVIWLSSLYNWWQNYDDHKSHLALHTGGSIGMPDRALLVKPSLLRMVAKELPGVGYEKSAGISKFFGSVENLVNAAPDDLEMVPGIGKELARRIYNAIREEIWR